MSITTEELFDRFNEETDILSDKKSLAVILYGSRISNNFKDSSDLDILVIVPDDCKYFEKSQRLIDGVPVEVLSMTTKALVRFMYDDIMNKATFYENIFKNGIVKKDKTDIVSEVSRFMDRYRITEVRKQKLDSDWIMKLDEYFYYYNNNEGVSKKYCYFNMIEYLKSVYLFMNDLTETPEYLTYDLYTNGEKTQNYGCHLPTDDYKSTFLEAMNPVNMDESIEKLSSFVGYENYLKRGVEPKLKERHQKVTLGEDTRMYYSALILLAKNIDHLEDRLIKNTSDIEYYYFNSLEYFYMKYLEFTSVNEDDFLEYFNEAMNATGVDERIEALEKLFHVFSVDREFDYSDYSL